MVLDLDAQEQRVLGTLIEKQLATPQYYPLTLAATVQGCNQATSREPVTSYDEATVRDRLDKLRHERKLVRVVHPTHGRSVDRYRQVLEEPLGLIPEELAVLGVLLLRGPQTAAELRSRTERLAPFEPPDTIDAVLDRLAAHADPLAKCLGRRPGQSQDRWVHLLGPSPAEQVEEGSVAASVGVQLAGGDRVSALEDRVAALEAEVAELKAIFDG